MPYSTAECPTCGYDVYVKNGVFVEHQLESIVKQQGETWLRMSCPSSGEAPQ